MSDNLTDTHTKHWTGSDQPLFGIIRVDGKSFRFLGAQWRWADPIPPLQQVLREVTPARTIYGFQGAGIHIDLIFLTPAIPDDLDLPSRPVTYIAEVTSANDRLVWHGRREAAQLSGSFGCRRSLHQAARRVEGKIG